MLSLTSGNSIKFSLLSLLILNSTAFAQTDSLVVDQVAPEPSKSSQAATFAIPASIQNVKQLMAFLERMSSTGPADNDEQGRVAHELKVARSLVAGVDHLSGKEISSKDALECVYFKLQGLQILEELDEPGAGELFSKAIEVAQADKRPEVRDFGTKFMVESGFSRWDTWGEEEKTEYIEKIIENVSSSQPAWPQINLVMTVVDFLGDMNGEVFARQLLSSLVPHFQTSEDPQILQELASLDGIKRRLNLPGNTIQIEGTMLDGTELDWSSYRGKVVLVDFWATSCGLCRAEIPNVLKMYHAYHDKGFEVVGISLDKHRSEAESYVKQMNIPWPVMFSKEPTERGWQHPLAARYGISGIPRAILVDRDGKVVHMTARGATLGRELRRLLGEPVARSQQRTDAFVQQVSNPPSGK